MKGNIIIFTFFIFVGIYIDIGIIRALASHEGPGIWYLWLILFAVSFVIGIISNLLFKEFKDG